jgi:hypothetical protein
MEWNGMKIARRRDGGDAPPLRASLDAAAVIPSKERSMTLITTRIACLAAWACATPLMCTVPALAGAQQMAMGDFNGDGFHDLVIGVPNEDVGAVADAGAVHIIYGSAQRLRPNGSQLWHQNRPQIQDTAEANDGFGSAFAVGDFNNDGFDDLAIGVPRESINGHANAGAVNVIYGSVNGLAADGDQLWHQDSNGIADQAEADDFFGIALTAGDFNDDGFDDLAIGASDENVGNVIDAGLVHVLRGSANGLRAGGSQTWHQNSPGILDSNEERDFWGYALAAGDFNNDGRDDLAVCSSDEDIGGVNECGALNILYGSNAGLTSAGNQFWHQNSPGIPGSNQEPDFFGNALAIGDFNGDNFDDIATGMRLKAVQGFIQAGAVIVMYGSNAGIASAGSRLFHQNTPNMLDVAEQGDFFGTALTAGDFDNDNRDDLAIGILLENGFSGAVAVLYGGASGLGVAGNQLWTQNSANILDAVNGGEEFGSSVIAGDFNGDNRFDLAIAAPNEDVLGVSNAGAVNVIYGRPSGLHSQHNQFWHQNSPGIADNAEIGDGFGGIPFN